MARVLGQKIEVITIDKLPYPTRGQQPYLETLEQRVLRITEMLKYPRECLIRHIPRKKSFSSCPLFALSALPTQALKFRAWRLED